MKASLDNELAIEPAKPDDAEAIIKIKQLARRSSQINEGLGITAAVVDSIMGDVQAAISSKREFIAQQKLNGSQFTFVAKIGGQIVGYTSPQIVNGQRRLGALYVLPKWHGQGIGGELLNQALNWHGRDHDVYLHVVSHNHNAIAMYEHAGFVATGKEILMLFDENNQLKALPKIEMVLLATVLKPA